MLKALRALPLVLLLVASCGRKDESTTGVSEPAVEWDSSYHDVLADAGEGDETILISFEARWCPWSERMRDSVLGDPSVIDSLRSLRCVRVDAGRDTSLVRAFGIRVFPTTVLTDSYGCELGRIVGYQDPEDYLGRLNLIRSREDILVRLFREEETRVDDPAFLITFGEVLTEIGMYDAALIRFDRATQIDSDDKLGTLEEATYSLAECFMLAGQYREAGWRFNLFARDYPNSDRAAHAAVLGGLCYERAGYRRAAREIYQDYLKTSAQGIFRDFVGSRLEEMENRKADGG
jgi:tetratricopeptide (TPR) repeat protein